MKYEKLKEYISNLAKNGVIVAFSGGVDSSLILKIASPNKNILACFVKTLFTPSKDLEIAKILAKDMNIKFKIIEIDNIDDEIILNRKNRCYHCKKAIFSKLKEIAKDYNYKYIIDGTNFDDTKVYRPGLMALKEYDVISPLAKFKITKKEVRMLAKDLDIKVHSRPSTPCLATRFPYDEKIDISKFEMIEKGEEFLKNLGFPINRIRIYNENTRIEIEKEKFIEFIEKKDEIIEKLKTLGFKYINLDLEGFRSGSMDI